MLAPSKEKMLLTAFTLYRGISRKKILSVNCIEEKPKETAISTIQEKTDTKHGVAEATKVLKKS